MNFMRVLGFLLCLGLLSSCAKPVANFIIKKDESTVPATVQFENLSEGAEEYTWYFGDGKTSMEVNPDNRYLLSGKYEVRLEAKKGGKKSSKKQSIVFDAPEICLIEMETNYGTMLIQLYDETPKHRDNFIKLAEDGYYSDLLFHRVIDGFMIQGGDPDSKGAKSGTPLGGGGPGYKIDAEFNIQFGHVKGALAAARQGDNVNPDKQSSGSQFYIVHGKSITEKELESLANRKGIDYPKAVIADYLKNGGTPFLDQEYTVFGRVVKGLEVVDAIAVVKKDRRDRPNSNVKILSVHAIK